MGRHRQPISRLGAIARVVVLLVALVAPLGCSAIQPMPGGGDRGLLRLEVEPPTAEVYIDSEYRGVVEGWAAQTIPVEAGAHRIELRADGYMTQRFDITVGAGEEVTLELAMEPELEDLETRQPRRPRPGHASR